MERRRHKDEGFTLVELMVIIGLLGLLFAMATPGTSKFLKTTRLTGATNTLVADIHYGRSLANVNRATYAIVFDSTSYKLRLASPATTVVTRTLPSGVRFATSDTAWFYAWGLTKSIRVRIAVPGDTNTVRLGANGGITRD